METYGRVNDEVLFGETSQIGPGNFDTTAVFIYWFFFFSYVCVDIVFKVLSLRINVSKNDKLLTSESLLYLLFIY